MFYRVEVHTAAKLGSRNSIIPELLWRARKRQSSRATLKLGDRITWGFPACQDSVRIGIFETAGIQVLKDGD